MKKRLSYLFTFFSKNVSFSVSDEEETQSEREIKFCGVSGEIKDDDYQLLETEVVELVV